MFIDGIKAIPSDGSEPRLWKFRNPQGAYKHLCVLAADESDARLIRQSIGYGLFGAKAPTVKGVLVALTDDNGDSWIFERSADQFRCLKNRQLLDVKADAPLRELFADFMPLDNKSSFAWSDLIRSFELKADGADIIAQHESDRPQRMGAFEQAALLHSERARQMLEQVWGSAIDKDLLGRLVPTCEAFLRRSISLKNQAKDLTKVFEQVAAVDGALIRRLEQELELIEQIRRQAEPLLQAGKSPKAWNEKLYQLELERTQLEEAIAQEGMPLPEEDVAWENVLQALTRYLACDRLEKSARASLQEAKDKITPIYDAHRAQMQSFLSHDRELVHTFEVCLHELEAGVHRAAEHGRSKDNLSTKLNKLLGFNPAEPLRLRSNLEPEDGLADARNLVNTCLHVIAELGQHLTETGGIHQQKISDFEARYQQIADEYARSKETWETLASQLGINPGTSVSLLILSINLYSQHSAIRHKMSKLQEEFQDYKQGVRALSGLLESWRTHTGSQKSLALEHPNVILAEAKGVISYADKKQAQVRKLRLVEAQVEAYSHLQNKLKQDEERVAQKWKETTQEFGLPHLTLTNELLETTISASRELTLIDSLRPPVQKALQNEQILGDEAFDVPLVIYNWPEAAVANKGRLQFLQLIEGSSPHGYALILCPDQGFVDMMQKMGLSYGQRALSKAPEVSKPVAREVAKPLISDKARSALEVFAAKQTGVRRPETQK